VGFRGICCAFRDGDGSVNTNVQPVSLIPYSDEETVLREARGDFVGLRHSFDALWERPPGSAVPVTLRDNFVVLLGSRIAFMQKLRQDLMRLRAGLIAPTRLFELFLGFRNQVRL
jgi:hypothetical protein